MQENERYFYTSFLFYFRRALKTCLGLRPLPPLGTVFLAFRRDQKGDYEEGEIALFIASLRAKPAVKSGIRVHLTSELA